MTKLHHSRVFLGLVCRWYARSGRELWEVRSSLLHGRIARVIFCVEKDCMVLLHGFMKKTQKTPKQEIDLALKRKKEAES